MHILFLSHYFPPEVNAPATRTYEHCVRWIKAGHRVTVITCAPNCPDGVLYDGYKNSWCKQREVIDGIEVVRVWTCLAPNAGTTKRIVNYLSYMFSAVWTSLWIRKVDVVIATSPQFFCGWGGVLASKIKRRPFVLEIRDIWPESIEAVGAFENRRLLRVLERLEKWMYRSATHIVAVGNGYRDNILTKVDVDNRISVITNGVDLTAFVPRKADESFLESQRLTGKFVCSYIGTIGMAHGLEVAIAAAKILKAKRRDDIAFVLVGHGAHADRLQELANSEDVADTVVFLGKQPKSKIPAILASSGACLIHLKGCELFGTVIPSKIFETLAMERPIVMGVRGEAREIVMNSGAGIEMEPDNAEDLVRILEELADDPEKLNALGRNAREFVEEHYDRDRLAEQYLEIIESILTCDESTKRLVENT